MKQRWVLLAGTALLLAAPVVHGQTPRRTQSKQGQASPVQGTSEQANAERENAERENVERENVERESAERENSKRGLGQKGRGEGGRSGLFRLLDSDRDGILSAEEINGVVAALMKLDSNRDGGLDAQELAVLGSRGDDEKRRGRAAGQGARKRSIRAQPSSKNLEQGPLK